MVETSHEETPRPDSTRLGRAAPWLAITLGAAITSLNLLHVNAYMLVLGPGMALAGIITLSTRDTEVDDRPFPAIPPRARLVVWAVWWVLLGIAAIIAHNAVNERPVAFFMIVAVACGLLVLTVGGTHRGWRVAAFIGAAILLSLIFRGSIFYLTPGFPGSDAWAHEQLTQALLESGHIPSEWDSPYYLHYPAMHLIVAMTATALGVSSKTALFIGVGLPLAFSALAVYVISRRMVASAAACIAALLILFTSYHLQWGTQIIPTSMGLALFSLALMLTVGTSRQLAPLALLLVTTVVTLVLCHTVSSFILWAALVAFLATPVVLRVFRERFTPAAWRQPSIYASLVLLTVVMFTHWGTNPYTPTGESFFEQILLTLRDSLTREAGFLDRAMEGGALLGQELLSVSGFALFYFLVILGALKWLKAAASNATRYSLIVAVASLSAIAFVFPLFGIRNIIPHRWFAFIWVLAAPLGVEGLMAIARRTCQHVTATATVTALCVSALVFLMVLDPISNTDSPQGIERTTQRMVFYDSEMRAADWMAEVADGPYASDLQFGLRVVGDHLGLDPVHLNPSNVAAIRSHYYLWRSTSLIQPVQAGTVQTVLGAPHIEAVESHQSKVYANRDSAVYGPST